MQPPCSSTAARLRLHLAAVTPYKFCHHLYILVVSCRSQHALRQPLLSQPSGGWHISIRIVPVAGGITCIVAGTWQYRVEWLVLLLLQAMASEVRETISLISALAAASPGYIEWLTQKLRCPPYAAQSAAAYCI